MLIVCNGAFKSGSTWLYNIVRELTGGEAPPAEYLNPEWRNPSIDHSKLDALLASLRPSDLFIVKNHFNTREQRDALLSRPDVRVLNITRDLRDMLVSAFYHVRRVDGYGGDFARYYMETGRATALAVQRYHRLWGIRSPQVYTASYERLHADFTGQVREIAEFLGVAATDDQIARLQGATSLDALRARYGDDDSGEKRFFRKGVVGDWRNHMTPEIEADLNAALRRQSRQASLPFRILKRIRRMLKAAPQ
jgi:LPS sulfotransferase NodH